MVHVIVHVVVHVIVIVDARLRFQRELTNNIQKCLKMGGQS